MKKKKRILHFKKSRVAKLNMLVLRGGGITDNGGQVSETCLHNSCAITCDTTTSDWCTTSNDATTPENPCSDVCRYQDPSKVPGCIDQVISG